MRFLSFVFLCCFIYSSECLNPEVKPTPYKNLDDAMDACTKLTNGPEADAKVVYECTGKNAPTGPFQDFVDAIDNCINEIPTAIDGKSTYTCKYL